MPFDRSVVRYALGGLFADALAAHLSWDGTFSRLGGLTLVGAYVLFVATIWMVERRLPTLGEAAALDEATEPIAPNSIETTHRGRSELSRVGV